MNEPRKKKIWITLCGLVMLLLLLPAAAIAQDDDGDSVDGAPGCNPALMRLATAMGESCDHLVAWRVEGVGVGEIMKAWVLSEDTGVDWPDFLERKQSGIGWGQIKAAYRFSDGDPEIAEQLFQLRQEGLGWGQIMQAQAIVAAGFDDNLTLDSVVEMLNQGLGWGEIRQELGLPPGPPPWAGGGKNKVKNIPPGQAMKDQE